MALTHTFRSLRITESNFGDWQFSAGSLLSPKYTTKYNDVTEEEEYHKEFRHTAAVTCQSAAVDLSAETFIRLFPLGSDAPASSGGATYTRRRYLISTDGGTTYYKKSGTAWVAVGIGSIATEGMLGTELVAAGLPTPRTNIKVAAYSPAGYNSSNSATMFGYVVVTGAYDTGYQRLLDLTGDASNFDYSLAWPDNPRIDHTLHHLVDRVGTYGVLTSGNTTNLNEATGFVPRDSSPPGTSMGFFTVDVSQTLSVRGYRWETSGTVDEGQWLTRMIVAPVALGEVEYPEHTTWSAWNGSEWVTVAAADYEGDPETYGMSLDQFNAAKWRELSITNGLRIWLYVSRVSNSGDDWWITGLYGYTMPYQYETGKTPPSVTVGTEGGNPEPVNTVFGWQGGRACRTSDVRGEMLPPDPITVRGVVSEYVADPIETGSPYFIASTLDVDGNASYFGMPSEPSTAQECTRWWGSAERKDDWTCGLIVHVYDDTASSSGAAGQWGILDGRDPTDPYKIHLERPFVTAPQRGDKFHIGQLVWIVFPEVGTAPPFSKVQLDRGEITMKLLRGELRATLEVAPSGENFEVSAPAYPWRNANHKLMDLSQTDIRTTAIRNYAIASSYNDAGSTGREISLGFATIVDRGDFKLEKVCYLVNIVD